ncbi:hypothetical protein ICL29_004110 [Salmonella enterica]|nr:hypothetical protein [Salmonella enterica]EHK5999386.1 hypothetical protein [Salmonella enterica]EIF5124605.1 hypothetical protein [Salmonella enterica]EIF5348781.1 hypothetical protein [Salmonella enterica]EIF5657378.1 hypothetical protein [Salmonella enterica]
MPDSSVWKLPRFFVPLFNSANVYLCRSKDEWDAACVHMGVNAGGNEMLAGACQQYRNVESGENLYLIGVFNGEPATLVHECAHAAFYCCRDVGVTIDTNAANETYCYLLGRMFSHFLPYIKQE